MREGDGSTSPLTSYEDLKDAGVLNKEDVKQLRKKHFFLPTEAEEVHLVRDAIKAAIKIIEFMTKPGSNIAVETKKLVDHIENNLATYRSQASSNKYFLAGILREVDLRWQTVFTECAKQEFETINWSLLSFEDMIREITLEKFNRILPNHLRQLIDEKTAPTEAPGARKNKFLPTSDSQPDPKKPKLQAIGKAKADHVNAAWKDAPTNWPKYARLLVNGKTPKFPNQGPNAGQEICAKYQILQACNARGCKHFHGKIMGQAAVQAFQEWKNQVNE